MAEDVAITSFDGNNVNGSTSYKVRVLAVNPVARAIDVVSSIRRNRSSAIDAINFAPLELLVHIIGADTATARSTWLSNVQQWFHPFDTDTRPLVATWHDETTSVFLDVYVTSLTKIQDARAVPTIIYECTMLALYPFWRKTPATGPSGNNPATITNAGNAPALPSIALTTATHKTLRACTVAAAVGFGFASVPILFTLSDANATDTNTYTFVNGISVPNYVINSGAASSAVWCLIDCASDGSNTYVDVIYGSSLVNPLCQQLDPGDRLANATGNTQTNWENTEWNVTSNPYYAGSWVPGNTGTQAAGVAQLTSDGATNVVFSIVASGTPDYDSIVLNVPMGADSNNSGGGNQSIEGISRVIANADGTNARGYARFRARDSDVWQATSYSSRANSTITTVITFTDGGVSFCVGLENDGATADPCTLTISGTAAQIVTLTANRPTVTVGAAANVDYYNGTYVVNGYTFTFAHCFAPDGTLTIDCLNQLISSSAAGVIYNRPKPSDAAIWAALNPGSNTITDGISATDTITHYETFT